MIGVEFRSVDQPPLLGELRIANCELRLGPPEAVADEHRR